MALPFAYNANFSTRLLLIAASAAEIAPLLSTISYSADKMPISFSRGRWEIQLLITGAGILPSTAKISHCLATEKFDLAIQLGIGGSYSSTLPIGSVVQVVSEQVADIGAESPTVFLPIRELPFYDANTPPFQNDCLYNSNRLPHLALAKGITVNTCAGTTTTIAYRKQYFAPDIESMEGASFFYACLEFASQMPFYQIRSISNEVLPRNTELWDIPLAVQNLNHYFFSLIDSL